MYIQIDIYIYTYIAYCSSCMHPPSGVMIQNRLQFFVFFFPIYPHGGSGGGPHGVGAPSPLVGGPRPMAVVVASLRGCPRPLCGWAALVPLGRQRRGNPRA